MAFPFSAAAAMACGFLVVSGGASAAPTPDPLDAQARVPAALHRSAFAGYRRLADEPARDWPEANRTVNRIGGWRTYAREAARPAAPASVPAAAHDHSHHRGHGGTR